jgi:DNA-binding GntR family transcriptional regulator
MLLRDTIYHSIRRAILICEFEPGQELREQILAERFDVSRSPIRDSLLRLERENLVTVSPRRGYRVNPISISDAEDLFGMRLLIEPACAAAAAKADSVELRMLDRFRGFATRESEDSSSVAYNASFHRAVAELSGNSRTAAIAWDLIQQFERIERIAQEPDREVDRRACAEHEAIIDSIQAHDPDRALRLAREHVKIARVHIITKLQRIAIDEADGTVTSKSSRRSRRRSIDPVINV